MRVYHFRDQIYGLRSIEEQRLKIARITELNDPFEFLGPNLGDPLLRRALRATKEKISEKTGVLCFSRTWSNPVQWSHYADNHKGLCLGFEVPDDLLAKVRYVSNRVICDDKIDQSMMVKILTTKYKHWNYEDEYRLFVDLDPEEAEGGLYFSEFSETLKLVEVILGTRSSVSRNDMRKTLKRNSNKVEVFKSRPAFKSFTVVRNRNESLWT